MLIALPFRSKR